VVLSGVTKIDRIDELQRYANGVESDRKLRAAASDESLRTLLEDDHGEIEPLI
jgi:hypothetical protein